MTRDRARARGRDAAHGGGVPQAFREPLSLPLSSPGSLWFEPLSLLGLLAPLAPLPAPLCDAMHSSSSRPLYLCKRLAAEISGVSDTSDGTFTSRERLMGLSLARGRDGPRWPEMSRCTSAAPRPHLGRTSAAPRPHLGRTSAAGEPARLVRRRMRAAAADAGAAQLRAPHVPLPHAVVLDAARLAGRLDGAARGARHRLCHVVPLRQSRAISGDLG